MGDVGSGKTMIALYAMVRSVEQSLQANNSSNNSLNSRGAQAALLAPTEIWPNNITAILNAGWPPWALNACC